MVQLLWLRENLCWGCSWGGRAAVQMLNAPGEAPGASGPASAPSFSSSSAWCAEKTLRVFGRGSGELRQPQRGFGKGTARWRCHPGVPVSPRGGGVTQRCQCHPVQRGCGSAQRSSLRCVWQERERRRVYSLELSIHHLPEASPPPPRCQLSQMCSVLEAAEFPVPGKGNHSSS